MRLAVLGLLLLTPVAMPDATAQVAGPEAANMRLLGHNDLQGRSAYQPTIHRQGDRWILYVGHHGGSRPSRSR